MPTNHGGSEGNRSRLISKLKDHMNEEIYVFSCPGVASIIMLKQKASHLVNAVSETDNDDSDSSMRVLSKKIIKEEARRLPHSKNEYNVIENENLMDACSETLMTLLSKLSQNFEKKFACCYDRKYCDLCGDKTFTKLQLALSVLASDR